MSEHWEFYFCQMGDHSASIMYDHGIAGQINEISLSKSFNLKLIFKHPREDGLSSGDEFETLCNVEDELKKMLAEFGGIWVGRITTGGARYFHCFAEFDDSVARMITNALSEKFDYDIKYALEEDADKKEYWILYPSDHEWQAIQNRHVLDALEKNGDDFKTPRRVDHWIYFKTDSDVSAFCKWAEGDGYGIESVQDLTAHIYHELLPVASIINKVTVLLLEKAKEFNGDYDGWEAKVMKPKD